MKTTKLVLAAVTGVLLVATGVQAQVDINISGAVAFRDTSYRAIRSLYGANLASENPDSPGNPPSSIRITWSGQITNLFGNQTVTIRANYNGAVAGIQDLVQNRNVSYRSSSTAGDTNLVNLQSDIAYGSVFQASTVFTSPALVDSKFGVTPVFFVKSVGAPAGLTNITRQQFRALAANGALPGWFFTGNAADTNLIYYISRDTTAGQRVIVQKESIFTGSIVAYQWSSNALDFVLNSGGIASSAVIRDQLNAATKPAISFLTGVDAVNVNSGQNIIGYNGYRAFTGATYSNVTNDLSNVINGQYSQWGYEHVFVRSSASPNVVSLKNALLAAIDTDLQTSAHSLPLSKVKVERASEGGVITPVP
ncbi:MAG: hypothetical protein U1F83_02160 [Verrucomicrobiota bacterium]